MAQDEIMIGAAGQMFALQIPENGGFTEHLVKFGAMKRGISGAVTLDNQGARFEFSWSAEDISDTDASLLDQLYTVLRRRKLPIRLILPHRKNMLSACASSAQSVHRSREIVEPYFPLSGLVDVATQPVLRPDQDALYPLSPRLPWYTELINVGGGGYEYVYPEGDPNPSIGTAWSRVPLIEGRTYTLSVLYRRMVTGTNPAENLLTFGWRRADGDNTSQPATTNVQLTSTTWAWASTQIVVPTGWPQVVPTISVADGATLNIAAMQLEEGNTRTAWTLGKGVPVINVTDLSYTDTLWPARTATMTMIEL